jgi:putative transcriptional regulator
MATHLTDTRGGAMNSVRCAGKLLVALPMLDDPNFERAVVLVIDHDEDGALGLVLNRPTLTLVEDVLAGWSIVAAAPVMVFEGGPVEPRAVVGLGVNRAGVVMSSTITDRIRTVDPSGDPEALLLEVEGARVFAGYAGWSPGQLEDEIEQGAWVAIAAEAGDVLCADPDGLWAAVLGRQPDSLRLLQSYPDDPRLN